MDVPILFLAVHVIYKTKQQVCVYKIMCMLTLTPWYSHSFLVFVKFNFIVFIIILLLLIIMLLLASITV